MGAHTVSWPDATSTPCCGEAVELCLIQTMEGPAWIVGIVERHAHPSAGLGVIATRRVDNIELPSSLLCSCDCYPLNRQYGAVIISAVLDVIAIRRMDNIELLLSLISPA
jgi:hypothetical protein